MAIKVIKNGDDETEIRWDWVGRAVAAVVITGIPAIAVSLTWFALRTSSDIAVLKRDVASAHEERTAIATVVHQTHDRLEDHIQWALEQKALLEKGIADESHKRLKGDKGIE